MKLSFDFCGGGGAGPPDSPEFSATFKKIFNVFCDQDKGEKVSRDKKISEAKRLKKRTFASASEGLLQFFGKHFFFNVIYINFFFFKEI